MKHIVIAALSIVFAQASFAAGSKTYQATGPVVDVKDGIITVEKDKEKWEIEITKDTKTKGEIKKGDKVTVQYKMTAASVEVKGK